MVVIIHKDGEDHAFYVDRFGYEEAPEFLAPVQTQERAAQAEDMREEGILVKTEDVSQRSEGSTQKEVGTPATATPQTSEVQPGRLTFFVAQCMDFPVMGEYHGELSLIEALKIYREMPDGQMGGKGIGFILQDGSEYAGDFALVAGGRVQEDVINGVEHYRLNPDIQAAIAEAKVYVPENGEQEQTQAEVLTDRAGSGGRQERGEGKDQPAGKKESVLTRLSEKQKKVKETEKAQPEKPQRKRAQAAKRAKGEQAR